MGGLEAVGGCGMFTVGKGQGRVPTGWGGFPLQGGFSNPWWGTRKRQRREGCRLVTTVDGSCLGVVGHDASRVGRAITVAMGRREGLQFTTMIFILYPPKQSRFDAILKNK